MSKSNENQIEQHVGNNDTPTSYKDTNNDFFDSEVIEVEDMQDQYALTYKSGSRFFLSKKYNVRPVVGDKIRFYRGYPTVGVDLNGKEVFYNNPTESICAAEKVRDVLDSEIQKEYENPQYVLDLMDNNPIEFCDGGAKRWNGIIERNIRSIGVNIVLGSYKWAKLMEEKIQSGKSVMEVADETLTNVLSKHSRGFRLSVSLALLNSCWKYGKQLDKWYGSEE